MTTKHTLPADIERTSMRIISQELEARGIVPDPRYEAVIRRVIHTTADFDYARNLAFTEDAVAHGVDSLKHGAVLITDTNMAKAGVSKPSLRKLNTRVECFMAEEAIAQRAKQDGTTRAVASMTYAAERYPNGFFAVGNAPTALLRLSELLREGLRPSLIIGVPVGFVNVEESKRELFEVCQQIGVPAIVAMGRKGGSNVAAAVCNALLYTACQALDPSARGWQG